MGTAHTAIRLTDTSDNVLMYLPITSVVEEIWQNDITASVTRWSKKGPVIIDSQLWAGEIVLQGNFVSTDSGVDSDFVTALRTLMGIPVDPITAREQYNWLLHNIVEPPSKFRLYYLDDAFKYSKSSVDIKAGKYPNVTAKEIRKIAEGPKDRIDWTIRFLIGTTNLRD